MGTHNVAQDRHDPSPGELPEGTLGSIVRALLMCLWQEILCNSRICSGIVSKEGFFSEWQGLSGTSGTRMVS